ncbi:unnamed protein product [Trichogramma brassicae]|uniref:Uncharacterized protein n=1 Tax=Trichogramma brassicae TaxID=86971 RepID=A0A6H5HUT4_9HYME|nr:unnamed protein product [Trichogramma brassicae]
MKSFEVLIKSIQRNFIAHLMKFNDFSGIFEKIPVGDVLTFHGSSAVDFHHLYQKRSASSSSPRRRRCRGKKYGQGPAENLDRLSDVYLGAGPDRDSERSRSSCETNGKRNVGGLKTVPQAQSRNRRHISECRDKIIRQNVKFTRISNRLKKCIDDKTSIFLKPAKESLKTLNETIVVIDEHAKTANKCIDEATLFTSFSAAKCLTKAQLSADVAWLKAPGQIDLSGLKWEYRVLLNKLTECQKQEAYEEFRVEIDSTDREVKNCVIDLVQQKRVA